MFVYVTACLRENENRGRRKISITKKKKRERERIKHKEKKNSGFFAVWGYDIVAGGRRGKLQ